jgi:4-hydroxy 2-oxovalerate aldolase
MLKYIDVTLRDGGHQHGFNWSLEFVDRYLKSISLFHEVEFVELGYWKQAGKFDGPFYSIDENLLSSVCQMTQKKLSIMVDYHYCSHDVEDFPNSLDFPELGLIRICLRKEDITEGCKFVRDLKNYTNCKISVNFFNITNYDEDDLAFACEAAAESNADFMYFADTHGGLDLEKDLVMFKRFTKLIKKTGISPGLHLHDHSGRAYFNYRNLVRAGFEATDVSLGGLGKGLGNLKLEHVFDLRGRESILDHLILDHELFNMPSGPYGVLTARDSITDHYAVEAERIGIHPSQFSKRLEGIIGSEKDNYNKNILSDE